MDSSQQNKKRKHQSAFAENVTFSVASSSNDLGPILAVFPAVQPPAATAFQTYREKSHLIPTGNECQQIIKGSTADIEFFSVAPEESLNDLACRYMVGVYDKSTKKVKLYKAPTHLMSRTVKALKNRNKPAASTEKPRWREQLNSLGEAFGSKKAITKIRAAERNEIDVAALQGVASHVQHDIDTGTTSLPSREEVRANMASARPIPPVNEAATKPSEVYNIFDVFPESEMSALSIRPYVDATSSIERRQLLPIRKSEWVFGHLDRLFSVDRVGKLEKGSLKLVIVVSYMMAFRRACKGLNSNGRNATADRMRSIPESVQDILFEKFTEMPRDSEEPRFTHTCDTRLMVYMFSLILRVDRWSTTTSVIASDIGIDQPTCDQLFRTLGCQPENLTAEQRKAKGWTLEHARSQRRMQLKLPLVFPPPPGQRKAAPQ